jgi:hypothetical protein
MSYEVLRAIETRLRGDRRLSDVAGGDVYIQAIRSSGTLSLDRADVQVVERPPLAELS